MTRGNIYSLERAWFARVNSAGIATGQLNPDSPGTAPLTSSAYLLNGPITLTTAKPTYAKAEFKGGGRFEGRADLGIDAMGDATISVSQYDPAFNALTQGGLVDTTSLTNAEISSSNHMTPSPVTGVFCGIGRLQKRSSVGNDYFHIIYPLCQMRPNDPDFTQEGGTNPSAITYTITPQSGTTFPVGIAFGSNQSWYDNTEFAYHILAANPYHLTSWLQDAAATTFVTGYRPTSSLVTTGTTTNWVARNGVATAPTSINTTSGLVTMPSAGTANQYTVIMYQTQFVAI
jgi:hypothetical protein